MFAKHDVFGFERKIEPSPEKARLISCSRMNGVLYKDSADLADKLG